MSKERELLKKILATGWLNNTIYCREVEKLLAQPEHIKEREVSGKIISTDDACNWNLTVKALKDYDHVYVNGIRYTEYKRGYARAELDLKREPLSDYATYDMFRASKQAVIASCYWAGIRDAEKAHGIRGEDETV